MDCEMALKKLSEYIERYLPIPSGGWLMFDFKERSYERFAAYEIYERIFNSPPWFTGKLTGEPLEIVDDYISEIDRLIDDETNTTASVWSYFAFFVAKNTAEDIRKLFLRIENGKGAVLDG